ncbi:MAG: hypothetical protein O6762_04060 [Thaumarchaeota archaeon]|nr:hypothetical protein [Nitrososphaerota archaeon]
MISKRFTESRIRTKDNLKRFLQTMDRDEGVRIRGNVQGFKEGGLIFITPSGGGYFINLSEHKKNRHTKVTEKWIFEDNVKKVMEFVEANRSKPLESWSY